MSPPLGEGAWAVDDARAGARQPLEVLVLMMSDPRVLVDVDGMAEQGSGPEDADVHQAIL